MTANDNISANENLTALVLNCTLKPAPASSSTQLLGQQILDALVDHGVTGSMVRVVDYAVHPGVDTDMGAGDQWPGIRQQILDADILVWATPTWLGQHSSVAQRVFERLDAEISETDDVGRPVMFGKVAAVAVVGNEDGAHHITGVTYQALSDVGFTIPAQGVSYWNGQAMHSTDYKDLDETPEMTATTTATLAANAVHLARLLTSENYPVT